jgi:glycosyltransferase involved in cell wall biosynthesis
VVAGKVEDHPSRRLLEQEAAADPRIRLWLDLVPHERVRELFEACDVAVFPRSEPWTSGSLILALSLGVPAVAARLSPYRELLGSGSAGWLFEPGDPESLRASLIEAAADRSLVVAKGAAALEQAKRLPTWGEVAARTAESIRAAVSGRDPNGQRDAAVTAQPT